MKKIFRRKKSCFKLKMASVVFTVYLLSSKLNMIVVQAASKKEDSSVGDTGVAQVNTGINVLKTLAKGIVSGIGFIILILGVVDFGTGLSEHNATQQHEGIKKIIAGIIVCSAPWIITAMGFA